MFKGVRTLVGLMLLIGTMASPVAGADVTFEVASPETGILTIEYNFTVTKAGQTKIELRNLKNFSGDMKVVHLREKISGRDFAYDVSQNQDGKILVIYYPDPIPLNGKYDLNVRIEGPSDGVYREDSGRWAFEYETGQSQTYFLAPVGHHVVYTSHAAQILERQERTLLRIDKEKGISTIVVKTRPFP